MTILDGKWIKSRMVLIDFRNEIFHGKANTLSCKQIHRAARVKQWKNSIFIVIMKQNHKNTKK